nr:immunoglobulin heavy chain junction region [Mus musculus]
CARSITTNYALDFW